MSQDKNGDHAQKSNRARPIEEFCARREHQQMAVCAVSAVTRCEADEGMMINCVLRSHFQHLSLFSPDEY